MAQVGCLRGLIAAHSRLRREQYGRGVPNEWRSDMAILMTAEVPGMTQEMVDGMTSQLMDEQKNQA